MVIAGVGLVAVAMGFVYWRSGKLLKRTYSVSVVPAVIPTDASAVARGKHIAETRGCVECQGADLAGAKVINDPHHWADVPSQSDARPRRSFRGRRR